MVKKVENIIVGISIGDLNGIGPEIVLKTFEDNRMFDFCTPVIFANTKIISFIKKTLNAEVSVQGIDNLEQIVPGKLNVLNVWREGVNLDFGKADDNVGRYAVKSFVTATKALKDGFVDVLVTAPINKYNIQSDEFKFPGHTDYLNQEIEGSALMLMVSGNLRIGLLTDHVPVNEITKYLTPELLESKIRTIQQSLIRDFGIVKPKIAVLGLNPHSGDNGVIGKEEQDIIRPKVEELFNSGIMAFGPYSSDSFFGSNQYEKFDAILAMYHDQGLIPFKTLSFGNGVNYTAGLEKIRTSPDHGTAYEIAGKGVASYNSFREAVYLAIDVFHKRNEYQGLIQNPLKIKQG
ncbi:4-hydroxythreonine-4-phosphate dehydrogenase PdxA [Flavobacterium sp. NRK F10]|uniref:4-hydroxythreonine-4-phosphate dehydrogenase PdxA n=1 Tax=Flavobacterium sp. NRK F10 TaxID=2954931 RepID=UPI0020905D47|nr:4-hydroxythreonine-4-phosphate dehydrogenase PdxA [Flavobacterium sp. NRK F10]MCO6174428.1 4-hydroxythreonine-4-phosphate dehydrogenase PdxA [Flavobacterium sp. NRK F10]